MLPALAALAALVVGLAYAAISAYWALGGSWLLDTVGISLSRPGQAGHAAALAAVWGAAVLKAVAAVLPVPAVRPDGPRPGGRDRRVVRALAWIEAAVLISYGLILTAAGLLVQAGLVTASARADQLALRWHAYLWDPWFLIWGILVFTALRLSRPGQSGPGRLRLRRSRRSAG
jgi:hypothetical protein